MSEDEQPRVATLNVTNDAWTDEIQLLIGLLEREFYVDAQMADGRLHIHRLPQVGSSDSDVRDDDMSLDEREEYVADLLERLRDSARDIEKDRTSTLDEVQEDLDGDSEEQEDGTEDRVVEAQVDEAVDSFEDKLDKMADGEESDEKEPSDEPADADTDESESDDRPTCQYCGEGFHPKGLKPHERSCDENSDTDDEVSDTDRYRCGGCQDTFVSERGVKIHQGRSRDCTGADIQPVEQTDTSDSAGSAADPTGDDFETPDATDAADEDDPELDPEVGAVPIDPDTVDEAVVEDDEPARTEDKHRVRREPSTIHEVLDAAVSGRYLCLDCGFSAAQGKTASRMKAHEFRSHGPYMDGNGNEYRQLDRVPDEKLAKRWLVIYKNVGANWVHPRVHEARKNGIVTVLEDADRFLGVPEIRKRINEQWGTNYNGEEPMKQEMLTDEPGYLDELVDEGRIEQDGTTYGVEAEQATEIIEATA